MVSAEDGTTDLLDDAVLVRPTSRSTRSHLTTQRSGLRVTELDLEV
jgi:hypothetical protein